VLNFSLPWGSFLAYFAPRNGGTSPYIGDDVVDPLLKQLIDGDDDTFRNNRLKIIPSCVSGPWLVR
jgi:Protein ENHANCED DISEASE RESISTANCE 2, C-terminal